MMFSLLTQNPKRRVSVGNVKMISVQIKWVRVSNTNDPETNTTS